MSENKLQPCPLCGGTNLLSGVEYVPRWKGAGINVGFVECLTEKCPMIIRAPTTDEAIFAWNKRPLEEKLEREKIYIQTDLLFAYEQLGNMRYVFNQMDTSPEKDKMIYSYIIETLEKLDKNKR